jgi:hypothetical protein
MTKLPVKPLGYHVNPFASDLDGYHRAIADTLEVHACHCNAISHLIRP